MTNAYADEFAEIPASLAANDSLRQRVISLINSEPMPGKVTEGGSRLAAFRRILHDLASGSINLSQAVRRTEQELPRSSSAHSANNKVFADGWAERLLRTQFSRFYNQAVLLHLADAGVTECFVPHSKAEQRDSKCSQMLAGRTHRVQNLLDLLVQSYALGNFSQTPKIPDHPHCTHVVRPLAQTKQASTQGEGGDNLPA